MAEKNLARDRLDIASLSNEDIAARCHEPSAILDGAPDVRCIARIADEVVVKCGWSVTAEEAANLELAYKCSVAEGNFLQFLLVAVATMEFI